jgi:transaldolase/glucose-6-phosphate isomerase
MPSVDILGDIGLGDELSSAFDRRLQLLERDEVVRRIWAGDHTVWSSSPEEITDRLGWLHAPRAATGLLPELRRFADEIAAEGFTHALLLGMGGSSLAPEVFRRTFGIAPGALDLRVLDTTHPDAIAQVERELPLARTLFVVSSKSGTTIETRSHLAYFHELVRDGRQFVAITDPGSPLQEEAGTRGFRRVFEAPPDVGGRYSALTAFGLVPAALIGADLDTLVGGAVEAAAGCKRANSGGYGAGLGEAALHGRDKLFLRPARPISSLGGWLEQLIAESTGKNGRGLVPVDLEPGRYEAGPDRIALVMGEASPPEPRLRIHLGEPEELGALMFLLEFATAIAGHVLGINPFDQPDVQSAKDRTAQALKSAERGGEEPHRDLEALFGSVAAGDYVAIQAFVAPTDETWRALQAARARIGERLGVAATLGYGPRYLHSTGQLHKGGPPTGVFVQVVQEPREDREIPGAGFTFGRLIQAQADGDLAALRERGRRVARVSLEALLEWTAG